MLRRLYYTMLLLLAVLLILSPILLGGCTKALKVEHTWTDGSVTKADYRNTGFNTSIQDFELRNGDTVIRLQRYNSETRSFEAVEKALDVAKQVAATAGKAGAP